MYLCQKYRIRSRQGKPLTKGGDNPTILLPASEERGVFPNGSVIELSTKASETWFVLGLFKQLN